jgi:Ca2+-transporting ATPase
MFGGVALLLAAVIGVPFFRSVMALGLPGIVALAAVAAMLGAATAWLEVLRRLSQRAATHRSFPT